MRIFNRMRMYGAVGPICSAQLPFQPALLQPGGKISPGTTKDDFCSRRRFLFFILKINRYVEENQGPTYHIRSWIPKFRSIFLNQFVSYTVDKCRALQTLVICFCSYFRLGSETCFKTHLGEWNTEDGRMNHCFPLYMFGTDCDQDRITWGNPQKWCSDSLLLLMGHLGVRAPYATRRKLRYEANQVWMNTTFISQGPQSSGI
jgi:hypothetical protein